MNHTRQQDGRLYKVSEVLTPGLHQNAMNLYVAKDGREVIMHNNKTTVNTPDGTEWTLASTRKVIAAAKLPEGPAKLPPSTPLPTVVKK